MTTGTGSALRPPRKRSGGFGFRLFLIFLIYCGGIYTGLCAARRIVSGGPVWLKNWVQQPAARPAAAAPVSQPIQQPAASPATGAGSQPAASPQPPANPAGAPQNDGSDTGSANGGEASPSSSNANLDSLVKSYNAILQRIQDTQHKYDTVQSKVEDPTTHAKDVPALIQQQGAMVEDISGSATEAQSLLAKIQADPAFTAAYVPTAACLPPDHIPAKLAGSGIDKLQFLEKRTE